MKKLIYLLVAVAAIAAAFFAWRMMMTPPDDLDLARSKPSAQGVFTVAVAPENEPLRQGPLHNWIATVTTPDGIPVEDATITIYGGMPQHGHGLPTAPAVTGHLGQGRYRIEGVRFNMGGWWELKLAIEAGGRNDAATFNIVL